TKGPVNGYLDTAAKDLSSYYEQKGQIENADQVLADAAARFPNKKYENHSQELQLERVRLLLRQYKQQEAQQLLLDEVDTQDADENYIKDEIAELHTELIMPQGNAKKT